MVVSWIILFVSIAWDSKSMVLRMCIIMPFDVWGGISITFNALDLREVHPSAYVLPPNAPKSLVLAIQLRSVLPTVKATMRTAGIPFCLPKIQHPREP